eukprot:121117_1
MNVKRIVDQYKMHKQQTDIYIYGFPAPISTNCKITNILLRRKIKQDTGWTVKNGEINYIIGKVWNYKTAEFEPGRGATIIVEETISQDDINIINATKDDTHNIYSITYYLDNKKNHQSYEQSYNNYTSSEQYHRNYNDDVFAKEKYITPTERHQYDKNALMESHKYIPPPIQSKISSHANDKKLIKKSGKTLDDKILCIPSSDQKRLHSKNSAISTKPPLQQTHQETTYHRYIPPPLRSKLLSNIKASPHDKTLDKVKQLCTLSFQKKISNDNKNIDDEDTTNTTKSPHTNAKELTKKSSKILDDKTLCKPSSNQERPHLKPTIADTHSIKNINTLNSNTFKPITYKQIAHNSTVQKPIDKHINDEVKLSNDIIQQQI